MIATQQPSCHTHAEEEEEEEEEEEIWVGFPNAKLIRMTSHTLECSVLWKDVKSVVLTARVRWWM